ncbi:RNA-guided endonuclease InsQ/TnpB family protein [Enterococcus mundtii]|uniref:RNA-guided endonuclease InsQ/TnpB family protein n=1 Tax=Enterococcus mundtii TaxID=53346 RepID=UPI001C63046D|nr:RNA-guided endonuclease TnpB family protein [Enterococcus mundtii]
MKIKERGEATRKNIGKQVLKVQKLHKRLTDIRRDRANKIVSELVKTKPAYITIEDLNVKGMMKNRHLSKAVREQSFYTFRKKLADKCKVYDIELRLVDRFYPSSKLCYKCGHKKVELKLSERTYHCENCGYVADRDHNACMNLKDVKEYKVIA